MTEASTVNLLNRPEIQLVATSMGGTDKGQQRSPPLPNSVDVEEPYHHELAINNKVKPPFFFFCILSKFSFSCKPLTCVVVQPNRSFLTVMALIFRAVLINVIILRKKSVI